ncbi:LOW QUALITY PROTEIN: long-chain-fatty-acid--CoA ligase 1-like [Penaeus monodon]|uniref:LOW QUALITY PROTEIN: long-chain-fatty-acid--CoA ligase 1-like n=1 Tax=Penaeus monodon TaxID=6687 RepID=UPI0018A7D5EA|nr:LOW QUALITY PROTEIN: long-chain-fatty-acid--CoA ligase 1-like [Penaeus monodon]
MATDTAQEVVETAFESASEALRAGTTEALRLANSTEQGRELVEMTGTALEQAGNVLQDAGRALKDLPAVAASEVKPKSMLEEYAPVMGGVVAAAAVVAATYYLTRPPSVPPQVDLDAQSHVIKEGAELIRVSRLTKEAREGKFMKFLYEDTRTLYDVFRRGVRESNNGPCLGWREGPGKPYQWLHYNEALLRAKNFGAGLVASGLPSGPETFVGIYSQNCPEWILTEQGLYCQSMVIVPLYDTLGPEACNFIINQASITTVVCQDDRKMSQLLQNPPKCLKMLVAMKDVTPETAERAKKLGITIKFFEQIESLGAASDIPELVGEMNTLLQISCTLLQLASQPHKSDVMISFLPLAHMLERCCEVAVYIAGGAVGFFSGDIRNLADDYKALRPTITPSVPRLMNRVYDKVTTSVNGSSFKKLMLKMAIASKKSDLERGVVRRSSIWDKLVFKKVQDGMGGRLRLLVVGSAPLAGNVLTFMRVALGCVIVEGYGQTECGAPSTLTIQGDYRPDHVGPPIACNAIKLVDVPDMDYYAAQGQGEVCIKGSNVFKGYFKDPEKTKEAVDAGGWLHTGDIGQWLPSGTLKIIDRKKHIFKLSQGEYIAPEKIENIYVRSQYVAQVFVHGESLKSCVVAIIVPEVEAVKNWAREQEIPGTLSVLCANPHVKQLIMDDIVNLGKQAGLKSFEQVKDIYLHPDLFSVQNGLLTPTLKSKRPQLKKYFTPQIDDMYAKLA